MTTKHAKHTPDTEFRVQFNGTVIALSKWRSKTWEWRILQAHPNAHGYMRVRIYRNGRRVVKLVHCLVAQYFLPPRPSLRHEIRHLDGDKTNNHYLNLAWGTRKDNADDRERHGRTSRGESHAAAIKAGLSASL